MDKKIVVAGATLIVLSIILGAFGAHSLENMVNQEALVIFEKGVKYQMYMGLGFLAIGLSSDKLKFKLNWFFRLGLIGTIIFSGMLYILTFKEFEPALKITGAIVPIGGTLMIVSWILLIFSLLRTQHKV